VIHHLVQTEYDITKANLFHQCWPDANGKLTLSSSKPTNRSSIHPSIKHFWTPCFKVRTVYLFESEITMYPKWTYLFLQLKVAPLLLEIHKLQDLDEVMTKFHTNKKRKFNTLVIRYEFNKVTSFVKIEPISNLNCIMVTSSSSLLNLPVNWANKCWILGSFLIIFFGSIETFSQTTCQKHVRR
jgi:hypothetical protein